VNDTYRVETAAAAALSPAEALTRLRSDAGGLSSAEAGKRLAVCGPNVLRSRGVSVVALLVRRLPAIDVAEMRELVLDAWQMVVPQRVAAAYAELDP